MEDKKRLQVPIDCWLTRLNVLDELQATKQRFALCAVTCGQFATGHTLIPRFTF